HLQFRERFHQDLPVVRLHSDRGGEFSSDLLRDFCRGEGILLSFTLPASPQQNGIAERRIALVMEVTRTSMIHAAAPHLLWPFAVWYAAHQVNLWPHKLSARAIPCVFLGFPPDAPGWKFYHTTSRCVFPSQDVTFDESVPFYPLFPLPLCPSPAPTALPCSRSPSAGDSGAAQGTASEGAASGGAEPGGAKSKGARSGGSEPGGAEPGGAEPAGGEPGGVESKGAESGRAEPRGAASSGGPAGASPRLSPRPKPLSPQQLREWLVRRARLRSGAAGAGATGNTGAGGAGVTAGASGTRGTAAAGPGGARTRGTGAAGTGGVGGAGSGDYTEPGAAGAGGTGAGGTGVGGAGAGGAGAGGTGAGGTGGGGAGAGATGVGGAGAGGAGAVDPGAGGAGAGGAGGTGAGGTMRPRPYFVPLLQHVLGVSSSTGLTPPLQCPPPDQSQPPLQPASQLPAPSPYTEHSGGLTALHCCVAELLDFAAACRLDYATALVAESESASPLSVEGKCALGTDVLEDRQKDFECLAAAIPRFASMLLAPEGDPDAPNIPTPRSYVEGITAFLQGSLHEEIWLRRTPGFTGSFPTGTQWSLRQPVYGLHQAPREWHDTLRTTLAALGFAPSTADPSLFLRTDTSLPPFYVLVYVNDLVLQRFGFQFSSPQPTPLSSGHSLSAPPLDESVEPSGTEEGTALLVQYVGHGARAWKMGSNCPHWSRRRFL
ncbi:unnamed protein product, partial [Closterium sp. NIES-54]